MRKATEIYEDRLEVKLEEEPKFGDMECLGTPEYISPEVRSSHNFIIHITRALVLKNIYFCGARKLILS